MINIRSYSAVYSLEPYDKVDLRQSITKQLNKVELSNRFSRAVFFSNNQEFQFGEKHIQEVNAACMTIIQNAIVLWNYLYLSQMVINSNDEKNKQHMVNSIKAGSAITWHHVNLHGEYDFTKNVANDRQFDINKILTLKV
ncbi:MAG: Tn3 family transposase [Rickettsiaceae bacterium]|nr:Tn3 family transposase [Rickettsiaceae bacterium]